jgi:hypothetical protein
MPAGKSGAAKSTEANGEQVAGFCVPAEGRDNGRKIVGRKMRPKTGKWKQEDGGPNSPQDIPV